MSVLSRPYFHDEAAAFKHVESIIWPDGPCCPHCGNAGKVYVLKGQFSKPSKKNPNGVERHGLKKCAECRKQFTVRIGTIFEESHIPLHKWLQAIYLMCSSKKGISSHQLSRVLEITVKSAWFLSHRIREAMRSNEFTLLGGGGGIVEVDETYIGKRDHLRGTKINKAGGWHKIPVFTLVSRSGQAKSFKVDNADRQNIMPIIHKNLDEEARVITDESAIYKNLDEHYEHAFVNHSKKQWGRGIIHTNTIEGYFSIFKRGMKGVYQHCSEKHLHRYLAEFDFRYNNRIKLGVDDVLRAENALKSVVGKRILYRDSLGV